MQKLVYGLVAAALVSVVAAKGANAFQLNVPGTACSLPSGGVYSGTGLVNNSTTFSIATLCAIPTQYQGATRFISVRGIDNSTSAAITCFVLEYDENNVSLGSGTQYTSANGLSWIVNFVPLNANSFYVAVQCTIPARQGSPSRVLGITVDD